MSLFGREAHQRRIETGGQRSEFAETPQMHLRHPKVAWQNRDETSLLLVHALGFHKGAFHLS